METEREQILLYKDNVELLSCMTMKYLDDFVNEHYPNDDCLWVQIDGNWINYKDLKEEGIR